MNTVLKISDNDIQYKTKDIGYKSLIYNNEEYNANNIEISFKFHDSKMGNITVRNNMYDDGISVSDFRKLAFLDNIKVEYADYFIPFGYYFNITDIHRDKYMISKIPDIYKDSINSQILSQSKGDENKTILLGDYPDYYSFVFSNDLKSYPIKIKYVSNDSYEDKFNDIINYENTQQGGNPFSIRSMNQENSFYILFGNIDFRKIKSVEVVFFATLAITDLRVLYNNIFSRADLSNLQGRRMKGLSESEYLMGILAEGIINGPHDTGTSEPIPDNIANILSMLFLDLMPDQGRRPFNTLYDINEYLKHVLSNQATVNYENLDFSIRTFLGGGEQRYYKVDNNSNPLSSFDDKAFISSIMYKTIKTGETNDYTKSNKADYIIDIVPKSIDFVRQNYIPCIIFKQIISDETSVRFSGEDEKPSFILDYMTWYYRPQTESVRSTLDINIDENHGMQFTESSDKREDKAGKVITFYNRNNPDVKRKQIDIGNTFYSFYFEDSNYIIFLNLSVRGKKVFENLRMVFNGVTINESDGENIGTIDDFIIDEEGVRYTLTMTKVDLTNEKYNIDNSPFTFNSDSNINVMWDIIFNINN